ncbi:MAG: Gfo/Idh/MocA family oxidoreductase [Fimbriimonadaceae bacterium]|nr:Gfo/Idh/MocA family oxidoreductase [Fimbriimonadaceae bacterium]
MAGRKLRVGVIGVGMGRSHAKGYQTHPQAELVCLCDLDEARLRAAGEELGVSTLYTDAAEMFAKAELDAVSVATPNVGHAPLTISALEAGLHVLCEKPMAMRTPQCVAMNEAAAKAGRNLMINFSYRFSDLSRALKAQVDAGAIGDVYFARSVWHRRRGVPRMGGSFTRQESSGGGPLIDLGVHRIDLALWLMGYPDPISVTGSAYNVIAAQLAERAGAVYTVEDLACGLVRFANGATLMVEASWAVNIDEREHMVTLLCGDKGGLTQQSVGGTYNFVGEIYTEEAGHLYTKKFDGTVSAGPSAYHEFVNSILEQRPPSATGEHGLKVQKILDGIYDSAATGREVRYD